MGIFKKPQKGKKCRPLPEGGYECERTERDEKTKEILSTGQSAKIKVNPSTCKARFEDFNVMDEDEEAYDEMADRMEQGCQKGQ